jgi:3-hydroxyisobutyrate dehydrogenase-like beta-hydroxyacid dehydrogenase
MNVTLFGLGEAGSLIAADLVMAGVSTSGFDPKSVPTPAGVLRHDNPAAAVVNADVVIALTAASDAITALKQALPQIPATAIYADFATASAGLKIELAKLAAARGLPFVDVALTGIVIGNGLRTPALASGDGARRFVELFRPLGMPVEWVSDIAGQAATRKLLRSIMMKGLAAVVIEAMRGAEKAGCPAWLWENMNAEMVKADGAFLARLMRGTKAHAVRRLHEMEAAVSLLQELEVEPLMTSSTVANLRLVQREGIPTIPEAGGKTKNHTRNVRVD